MSAQSVTVQPIPFTDSTNVRDRKYPLRVSNKEMEMLKAEARKRGLRDVATLIRLCIRTHLAQTTENKG